MGATPGLPCFQRRRRIATLVLTWLAAPLNSESLAPGKAKYTVWGVYHIHTMSTVENKLVLLKRGSYLCAKQYEAFQVPIGPKTCEMRYPNIQSHELFFRR